MKSIINQNSWIPSYSHIPQHIYVLLTSLNLGGAEKIVSDQLWANYFSEFPQKVTLILIYDKEKEHSVPKNVNVVRLKGKLSNGELLFNQITYENKVLVAHLINDQMAYYLFSLGTNLIIVAHNDQKGWVNTEQIFNHPQLISIVAVCEHVKKQLQKVTNKKVITIRHQISQKQYCFREHLRIQYRQQLHLSDNDILIGMTGRICYQKNYFQALDILKILVTYSPQYKLVILGGIEKKYTELYLQILHKINTLKLHNHVILMGFQINVKEIINAFDIALNTSYYEGLSMATQEMIMNGLPMVLSNVSGQKEIYDPNKQLHFFDFPIKLREEIKEQDSRKLQYDEMCKRVAIDIQQLNFQRITFSESQSVDISNLCYGSHSIWNLLNYIKNIKSNMVINPIFLTSNLNLGGAQRSLINILCEFKNNGYNVPLLLLNQSNQLQFFNQLIEEKIEHFLCHQSSDVFDICTNLFSYLVSHNINRIVLWNVDTKIKLLLDKFLGDQIDIIDVSPGDYCLVEMDNEFLFQEAIYHKKEYFYQNLYRFVSKYDNDTISHPYKQLIKQPTVIIHNGVPISSNNFYLDNPVESFKFLVCGRIAPSKHLEVIFSAFEQLLTSYPHCSLDCYGSVEKYFYDYYQQLNTKFKPLIIANKINWCGHHESPQSIMKNYHAIIVLGTHQGSPNVVLEAAACKLPIISNDSGGTKEIINSDTGILLPTLPQADLLLEGMQDMIKNYHNYLVKSEICYQLITNKFSMNIMYEQYKKVIFNE